MKKFMSFKLWCVFTGILFLCTCSDDPYYGNYEDGYASDLNRLYSNKAIHPERNGDLQLTYSGGLMLGKEIYFEMATSKTGRLKFYDVFPGEREVLIEPFDLISANGGYIFNSQSTTPMGITYQLSGSIEEGKLTVALSNIKMPDNILSQQGTFKMINGEFEALFDENYGFYYSCQFPFLMDWYVTLPPKGDTTSLFDVLSLTMSSVVSTIITQVLPELTFGKDGNVTAKYAPLNGIMGAEENLTPAQESPLNLIQYYIKDDYVFVVPNIEMIMYTVQTNQTRAEETGTSLGEIILTILDVYPTIKNWATDGIRFNLKENKADEIINYSGIYCCFAGDYQFYIDETEFYIDENGKKTLFSVLIPLLTELIDFNIDLGGISIDLTDLVELTQYTSSLKLGLYLSTEN